MPDCGADEVEVVIALRPYGRMSEELPDARDLIAYALLQVRELTRRVEASETAVQAEKPKYEHALARIDVAEAALDATKREHRAELATAM